MKSVLLLFFMLVHWPGLEGVTVFHALNIVLVDMQLLVIYMISAKAGTGAYDKWFVFSQFYQVLSALAF